MTSTTEQVVHGVDPSQGNQIQDHPPPAEPYTSGDSTGTVVQCSQGHLYTTVWIPLVSFKAIRLWNSRWQRCPVGRHWSMTQRVDIETLTPEKRAQAAACHDGKIP